MWRGGDLVGDRPPRRGRETGFREPAPAAPGRGRGNGLTTAPAAASWSDLSAAAQRFRRRLALLFLAAGSGGWRRQGRPLIRPGSDRFAFYVAMIVSAGSCGSAAAARASVVRSAASMPASCVSPGSVDPPDIGIGYRDVLPVGRGLGRLQ